jgi:hypothetical protein
MNAKHKTAVALGIALLMAGCKTDPPPGNNGESHKLAFRTDCYAAVELDTEIPSPDRAVFVLVDQTTGLDKGLRNTITANVAKLLGPGTAFSIATFSARTSGRYATILAEGQLQAPPPEELRPDLPVTRLDRLDACLVQQAEGMKLEAAGKAQAATKVQTSTFTSSEILASLTQLSEAVEASDAKDKLVIVVSDLLEHSPVTTFYSNKDLRRIDPAAELEKAREGGLIGNFDGARIAIVGAGLLSGEKGQALRDTAALAALRSFWESWIEASGGQLAQYGEPDLVKPLRWDQARAVPSADGEGGADDRAGAGDVAQPAD